MQPMVSIRGVAIPASSVYTGYVSTSATFVDNARNLEGKVVGQVVRSNVKKIELRWNIITPENWAMVCSFFDESQGGSFSNMVTFWDQDTNSWITREMYASDRTSGVWLRRAGGAMRYLTNARIALIEV